jgi:hypothetical protein
LSSSFTPGVARDPDPAADHLDGDLLEEDHLVDLFTDLRGDEVFPGFAALAEGGVTIDQQFAQLVVLAVDLLHVPRITTPSGGTEGEPAVLSAQLIKCGDVLEPFICSDLLD